MRLVGTAHLDLALCALAESLSALLLLNVPDFHGMARTLVALIMLLVVPGYVLQALLFPQEAILGSLERLALGIGLSMMATILTGFVLSLTVFGLTAASSASTMAFEVLVLSAVAVVRREREARTDHPGAPRKVPVHRGRNTRRVIVFTVALIALVGLRPHLTADNGYTEFYVLLDNSRLPKGQVVVGPKGAVSVTAHVVSHEKTPTRFRVVLTCCGVADSTTTPVLRSGEAWEATMQLHPRVVTGKHQLFLRLFRSGSDSPYRTLRLQLYSSGRSARPSGSPSRRPDSANVSQTGVSVPRASFETS